MAREDFQIIGSKPVGRGSFGTVFAARRVSDDVPVALKIVLHSGEWGPERIEAERKGAILQQRFAQAHGMVPAVYDYGQDGDDFYIAMEFVDGTSLEGLLRGGSLAPEEAVRHTQWLCSFLEKAHAFCGVVDGNQYRIVHTDLKPAHLMVAASGERKVLDFGIAKALEESRELGTDIGRTIAYAAPERLVSDQVNPHADFWSLGVMLYEMLCGHRPYPHLDGPRFRRDLEHAITSNAPRAPFPPSCPANLKAIVNKLLAFQVEHRYPDAAAIKADLERFLRGETPLALTTYETPATTPVRREAGAQGTSNQANSSAADQPTLLPPKGGSHGSAGGSHGSAGGSHGSAGGSHGSAGGSYENPATTPRRQMNAAELTEIRPHIEAANSGAVTVAVPPAVRPRSIVRRVVGAAAMFFVVFVIATEGVAWLFAERFRDTMSTLDERTVGDRLKAYAAVDRWAPFDIGLRARVNPRLLPALVAVGDRVIADYRNEQPAMGPSEWTQAYEAFTWARAHSRRNSALASKQLTAEGHVKRFAAQAAPRGSSATLLSQAALAKFREAADADPKSFDPYLGMARLQVYSLADVDGAAASIAEAEKRGYKSGRREAAMLGDGYFRRAQAARSRADVLTGEQRWRELSNARADYERCVVFFDPIVAFGNAAENLEACKAQVVRIERQLMSGGF